jgi:hypothetical protein
MAEDLEAIDEPVAAAPDPAEQEALARQIGEDLTDAFVGYVHGEIPFEDLTFRVHDALQSAFFVRQGSYDLLDDEDDEDWEEDEGYDLEAATAEQEDLAQEPARG